MTAARAVWFVVTVTDNGKEHGASHSVPLSSWPLSVTAAPLLTVMTRQAVNYAIDRTQVLHLSGAGIPRQATVTCQILPAGFPGHQPYCPYTAGPKNGFWHGPDLAKGRRLAKESRTTNVPVTVWDTGINTATAVR